MAQAPTPTPTPTSPGMLLIFSDPGDGVSEDEFNDWYDNEHIPLRLPIPGFLSWHRWAATDAKVPRYAASYDLASANTVRTPPYTDLSNPSNQSEREQRVFRDAALIDRRVYEQWGGPLPPPSALYDPGRAAPYTVFVSADVKPGAEEEYNRWYDEEHTPMLSKCPGWIRSRRFVLRDWARAGVQGREGREEGQGQTPTPPPKFLAVHEWESIDVNSEEHKAASSTPWRAKVFKELTRYELRMMRHYRSWERE